MSSYKSFSLALYMGLVVLILGGCQQEEHTERAGKEIDEATEKLGEAVKEKGPVERAGEKIDNAVEDAGKALEETGDKVKKSTE